ncbi:MAG: DNA polymerase III subunit alpha [Candidatus Tagabacteria bacterium CG09_land_8_20_14_0_10_41_14]|uniref:DNA polymerase III subunit alpha n=2 Tax=Candidatus Tagaibacteriota TaxID=1817918 RepID=A0A2H0WL23_9BACT|nr:MAG: DNA polymerase III subunit alpha [Candidatus Tagabacteria bacterium CG09_land_8_20_14_0_10_41_14]PJE72992.1 MAG: DNA polymerase III subunit alpha [Candidatus Tagabacteria bacterium CG10_big_fil_rev_8_21_14_0_10_40_13]
MFVHLHTHSHYSLLDGLAKVPNLVNEAVENKMSALALTDHGNMHGIIQFYKKAIAAEIKPILGTEAYIAPRGMRQKEAGIDAKPYHLILLAKNEEGYKNLLKLTSAAHIEGFYYKPRMDKELLAKYSKGLIASTACLGGEIPRLLLSEKYEQAQKTAEEYQNIFGKDSFFLEIQHHPTVPNYDLVNKRVVELGKKMNIPVIATQDIHYLKKEDAAAQDALLAIQTNSLMKDHNRLTMKNDDYSFRSTEEMASLFKDVPEAIENTVKIAEKCNVELNLGEWIFPKFEIPGGKNAEAYLREKTAAGLKSSGFFEDKKNLKKAKERIDYELGIINNKGYAPYFLIVADFVNHAKARGIITNTRGSAAGSFVSYLIGISNVDPLKYNLPFERFLNPYRPSPPDIDMDFADDRRDELIEYAKQRYGLDKVAQIGTFGTMMARGSVRDITRVLDYSYPIGDRIAKMIPFGSQGFPMSIKKAIGMNHALKNAYENESETKEILDLAQKIEGSARHISVHAAGVVISPDELINHVPLQREPNGDKIITQYDMAAVEDVGLLKFDFLGIRNLSILGRAVDLIEKLRGEKINLDKIPLDDKKSFELVARGNTIGLFQLGGSGMTKYLKQLKPSNIADIMAMIALFRPGPIANIPSYINRKHGKEPVSYLDPRLEKILGNTYGVVTYQEDVLLIAMELAGYNWGTVDKFRKAIGKKIPAEMAKQEKIFIEGCQKHGNLSKEKAETLWRLFNPFKGYGFNKAHAASYGMVAYQTAYLKANYPGEFMTAVLSAEAGDTDKISEIIGECNRMGIKVLPPDINESFGDFMLVNPEKTGEQRALPAGRQAIRFGLSAIKNVGENIIKNIVNERKANGLFTSVENLLERIQSRDLNKKSIESLIKVGALDGFEERNKLLFNLEKILAYHKETKQSQNFNQSSLFSAAENAIQTPGLRLKETEPLALEEKLKLEKELLGLYISGHPLDKYRSRLKNAKLNIKTIKTFIRQTPVIFAAMPEAIKKIMTKNGEPMAFIKFMDLTDSIESVVFPKTLNDYGHLLEENKCVIIRGRLSHRNDEPNIICEEIREIKL